jgi:hypothetical protein
MPGSEIISLYSHIVVFVTEQPKIEPEQPKNEPKQPKSETKTKRFTVTIPYDIDMELNFLKSACGARSRDEVIKEVVHATYALAKGLAEAAKQNFIKEQKEVLGDEGDISKLKFQALDADQIPFSESSKEQLFDMLNSRLSKYWRPFTKL